MGATFPGTICNRSYDADVAVVCNMCPLCDYFLLNFILCFINIILHSEVNLIFSLYLYGLLFCWDNMILISVYFIINFKYRKMIQRDMTISLHQPGIKDNSIVSDFLRTENLREKLKPYVMSPSNSGNNRRHDFIFASFCIFYTIVTNTCNH